MISNHKDLFQNLLILNICLFIFGGFTHSTEKQDLEKELNVIDFHLYNSLAWFLNQNYFLLASTVLYAILKIFHCSITIILQDHFLYYNLLFNYFDFSLCFSCKRLF